MSSSITAGWRRAPWLAAALVAVYVVGVAPSLGQPLLETHAHRQTQTAYTAVLYARDGIDLLRPPLPILGPPGSIPQEFPLFQAFAALVIDVGAPADLASRLVGLATFVACAVLVWLLARRLMGSAAALVALAAFLFNAHAWLYGRTSLIEYLAAAGGIGFVYFAIRWMEDRRGWLWAAALLTGFVGIAVKITTGGFYLLPPLLWKGPDGRRGYRRPELVGLVALTVAVGLGWSAWAQAVREETPASLFLSMENQFAWFFGTMGLRLDPAAWRVPLVAMLSLSGFGLVAWGAIAIGRARRHPQAPFLIGLLSLVAVMPLLLFNLYAIHDYYWAAVAPVVAIAVGLGVEWIAERWRSRWVRRLGVGLAGAWVATIVGTAATWSIIYGAPAEEGRAMRIAEFIRDASAPEDWVVLRGWGWNSTFLYYADRRGLAVPESHPGLDAGSFGVPELSDVDVERILRDPVFGPFIACDREASCQVESGP